MDPDSDPDPAIFVIDLQDASKKLIFNTIFSAYYFLKVLLHHFSKVKRKKKVTKSSYQGFSYCFCLMIKGSGSIPLTNGSGSGFRRPKNIRIRRIRVGICNTGIQGSASQSQRKTHSRFHLNKKYLSDTTLGNFCNIADWIVVSSSELSSQHSFVRRCTHFIQGPEYTN